MTTHVRPSLPRAEASAEHRAILFIPRLGQFYLPWSSKNCPTATPLRELQDQCCASISAYSQPRNWINVLCIFGYWDHSTWVFAFRLASCLLFALVVQLFWIFLIAQNLFYKIWCVIGGFLELDDTSHLTSLFLRKVTKGGLSSPRAVIVPAYLYIVS